MAAMCEMAGERVEVVGVRGAMLVRIWGRGIVSCCGDWEMLKGGVGWRGEYLAYRIRSRDKLGVVIIDQRFSLAI